MVPPPRLLSQQWLLRFSWNPICQLNRVEVVSPVAALTDVLNEGNVTLKERRFKSNLNSFSSNATLFTKAKAWNNESHFELLLHGAYHEKCKIFHSTTKLPSSFNWIVSVKSIKVRYLQFQIEFIAKAFRQIYANAIYIRLRYTGNERVKRIYHGDWMEIGS